MARIQVVIDEGEREEFRARAKAEGMSLSEWLRAAGRDRAATARQHQLTTPADIHEFFDAVDAERDVDGKAAEEDWHVTKGRMQSERYRDLDPLGLDT